MRARRHGLPVGRHQPARRLRRRGPLRPVLVPTRHEQREGRVDRFGQHSPKVRATLLYGATNPVDGVVLEVILRKAETVRADLGVPVPIPDDGHALSQALMKGP